MLRKVFGTKRVNANGSWRKTNNEKVMVSIPRHILG
jgi:hypothetical protein